MPHSTPGWNRFRNERSNLDNFDVSKADRKQELGFQFAFEDEAAYLASAQRIASMIGEEYADIVPSSVWNETSDALVGFVQTFNETRTFNPGSDNPVAIHNRIKGSTQSAYRQLFDRLSSIIAVGPALTGQESTQLAIEKAVTAFASKADERLSAALKKLSETDAELATARAQAQEDAASLARLLEETRRSASEVIASSSAEKFSTASLGFEVSARRWLAVTCAVSACLLGLALAFTYFASIGSYKNLDAASSAQLGVAKLALLAIVGAMLAVSVRNYTSARHNQTVNQHRSNAVPSYRSLMEATTSPEHKDVILTHAASAVFAPQETGFGKAGVVAPDLPSPIFNMLTKG